MPVSCRIVFDVLRTLEPGPHPVRELAEICRLSPAQVWRALRRLEGAHLIHRTSPGQGRRPAAWQLRWKSFPQACVSPRPNRVNRPQGGVEKSHTDLPVRRPAKAIAWGMARAREELSRWPIPWGRRNQLLSACGVALRRAWTRPPPGGWTLRRWRALVRRLLARLGERELPTGRALFSLAAGVALAVRDELADWFGAGRNGDILGMEVTYGANSPVPDIGVSVGHQPGAQGGVLVVRSGLVR